MKIERWTFDFHGKAAPVRRYLDTLTDALVVRQLPPWFENLGKRQVRSPKVYLRDTGLLHTLLGLVTRHQLLGHREGRPRPPAGRGDRLRW